MITGILVLCFNHADGLLVAPVYSAGEEPIEGVDAEWLSRGIKEHGHKEVILCRSEKEILSQLSGILKSGDVVMTLGAGDVHRLGEKLLKKL